MIQANDNFIGERGFSIYIRDFASNYHFDVYRLILIYDF